MAFWYLIAWEWKFFCLGHSKCTSIGGCKNTEAVDWVESTLGDFYQCCYCQCLPGIIHCTDALHQRSFALPMGALENLWPCYPLLHLSAWEDCGLWGADSCNVGMQDVRTVVIPYSCPIVLSLWTGPASNWRWEFGLHWNRTRHFDRGQTCSIGVWNFLFGHQSSWG